MPETEDWLYLEKIGGLGVFVNINKPLGKPLLAMFYTRCYVLAFLFFFQFGTN